MRTLRRYRSPVALGIGAIFCFWLVVDAFTADSYSVCTQGDMGHGGYECFDWIEIPEPPSIRQSVADALVPGIVAFALGYVALKTWPYRHWQRGNALRRYLSWPSKAKDRKKLRDWNKWANR